MTDYPTTRRFSRTLYGVDAAFRRDAEYANCIDVGHRSFWHRLMRLLRIAT